MALIKNYPELSSSDSRKIVLNVIEAGLSAVQFTNVLEKNFTLSEDVLKIQNNSYNLKDYERVFMIAFGKGSASVAKILEKHIKNILTEGFVIDVSEALFDKLDFTLGTHPLPSEANINFTKKVLGSMSAMTEKDLVLIVICGGGSVMFEAPFNIDIEKLIETNKSLLASGADIFEINTIRKHLSKTKGGGLAKLLYPAKTVSMIFSDVPGNDLSFIASGPTVKDDTSVDQALEIYKKYNLQNLNLTDADFTETPKEEVFFKNVDNILMLSNMTGLMAMKQEAEKWDLKVEILTDKFQSDSEEAGKRLIDRASPGTMLLVGGETTVKVTNLEGKGGRNQHLVLSALSKIGEDTTIASIDSDGWDNTPAAGAIGDLETLKKARLLEIKPEDYLNSSNSFLFFDSTEDAIITDRLPSNVADMIIVYKK